MTTLKEHEHLVAELHTNAFSKSTELLSHAVLDILVHLNATMAPNNNDALLANDLKACAPQNSSESARIKELQSSLRLAEERISDLVREREGLRQKVAELTRPEQAGCRKCDTQVKDDGWIEWGGGKRPVDSTTLIEIRLRNGQQYLSPAMHYYEWRHFDKWSDIIAYRVVKP